VVAFQLLSQSLRTDLRFAIFKPCILRHPLYLLWHRVDPSVLSHMCQEHVGMMHLSPQDDLFLPGAKCDKAYYVVEGDVDYIQEPSTSAVTGRTVQKVPKGAWISAAALWCEWIHVGQAVAHTTTKLMWVNAEGVFDTMTRHSLVHDISLRYARSFQQRLCARKT
jgi:CRP-like cAMP-binding protein